MKKLKDIVHDLEYAKKLKELGVKQDSIYYSTIGNLANFPMLKKSHLLHGKKKHL